MPPSRARAYIYECGPKNLAIYQALARFGVNFDLAMFNFDFNYSISMNSAGTDSYRTSYHQLQLNAAYLF